MAACWSPRSPATGMPASVPVAVAVHLAEDGWIVGQHRPRDAERVELAVVPVERLEVHQHRAARVRDVGDVRAAVGPAGQVPDAPTCPCCRTRGRRPRPRRARRRRCRGSTSPSGPRSTWRAAGPTFSRKRSWPPSADSSSTDALSVRVSCQTRALWTGSPVFAVPDHRRLALVRDADGREVARLRCPAFFSPPSITSWLRAQISFGSCSTQPGFGIDLLVFLLIDADHLPPIDRRS